MSAQRLSRDEFLAAAAARIEAAGLCNQGQFDSNTKKPRTDPCRQCGGLVPQDSRYRYFCKDACETRYRLYPQEEDETEPARDKIERLCVYCGNKHFRNGNICSTCERTRAANNKTMERIPNIVVCACGCGRTFDKRRTTHIYFDPFVCKNKVHNDRRRNKHNERSRDAASGHHGQEAQQQDLPRAGEPQGGGVVDQPLTSETNA